MRVAPRARKMTRARLVTKWLPPMRTRSETWRCQPKRSKEGLSAPSNRRPRPPSDTGYLRFAGALPAGPSPVRAALRGVVISDPTRARHGRFGLGRRPRGSARPMRRRRCAHSRTKSQGSNMNVSTARTWRGRCYTYLELIGNGPKMAGPPGAWPRRFAPACYRFLFSPIL
jgi:hypothetical protein